MSTPVIPLKYIGRNLLFLEEVLDELRALGVCADPLFRASEAEELARILAHGTDRGGFPGARPWLDGSVEGRALRHEDVIYATTAEEIRLGESEPERSTSLKKFDIIERPLLLVYDAAHLRKLCDRQYEFLATLAKPASLLAVFRVTRLPAIQGWFSEAAGLSYRALARTVRGGTLVEVGSWKGLSTAYVGRVCAANETRLVAVDSWGGSSDAYDPLYRKLLAEEDVPTTFRRNMAALGIAPVIMHTSSHEAAQGFAPESVDQVFLDGSHDYEAVAADLASWFVRLKPGGILSGHDYNDDHPGLTHAVNDFAAAHGSALKQFPGAVWWLRK